MKHGERETGLYGAYEVGSSVSIALLIESSLLRLAVFARLQSPARHCPLKETGSHLSKRKLLTLFAMMLFSPSLLNNVCSVALSKDA